MNSRFVAGTIGYYVEYMNCIIKNIELDADAFKIPHQVFIGGSDIRCGYINRMGIKVGHHFVDGIVLKRINTDIVHISIFDEVKGFLKRGTLIPFKKTFGAPGLLVELK